MWARSGINRVCTAWDKLESQINLFLPNIKSYKKTRSLKLYDKKVLVLDFLIIKTGNRRLFKYLQVTEVFIFKKSFSGGKYAWCAHSWFVHRKILKT